MVHYKHIHTVPTMPTLTEIAKQRERAVLRAFRDTVQSVKDQATIAEIVRLLEVGNLDGVIDLLQLNRATFEPLEESIRQSYREGGLKAAEQVGRIPTEAGTIALRFDTRSPRAERWLEELSSGRIVEVVEEQRTAVRQSLARNLSQGRGPRASALDLVGRIDPRTQRRTGGIIGMTERQAQWSASAREELENLDPNYFNRKLRDKRLDGRVRRAIESNEPLRQQDIDTAVTRMQERTVRYRGEVIARTESISALSEGQNEGITQAIESGEVDRRDVIKFWDATGDARTREAHSRAESAHAEGIPFDDMFMVDGEPMRWPRDPNGSARNVIQCRCKLRTRIRFGDQLKRIEGFD